MICLIVDDDIDTRDTVAMLLSSQGVAVKSTGNLYGALDILKSKSERVDMMLLDWNLPGMPMREFLEEVKRVRPNVAVVLSTAAFRCEEKAKEHGLAWYLPKPILPESLSDLIVKIENSRGRNASSGAA
jgi:DNA-binding NtrC family response regulator